MSAQIGNNELSTKSLFTAVLYSDVPEFSALSSTGKGSTYLKQIRREHLARASMEEVGSQIADSQSVTKVAQLAERAKQAYFEANGNPADGRWIFVSDLLRLHCTRGGRRWIGTNTSVEAPAVPEHLCIIPETSDEWNQLDHKRKEKEDVKSRVQRWITTAEFEPLTHEAMIAPEPTVNEQITFTQASLSVSQRPIQTKQTTLKAAYDPANSANKFGFPVVKRSHLAGKGKPDFGASRRSPSPHLSAQQSHAAKDNPQFDASQQSFPSPSLSARPSSVHMPDRISEFSDPQPLPEHNQSDMMPAEAVGAHGSSFLPPSFPSSQIQTSTPISGAEAQNQPPTSSKPPPSPSNDAVELSRPAIDNDLSSASHRFEPLHLQDGHSRKRVRSPSQGGPEPVTKRPRISHEADRFSLSPGRRPDVEDLPLSPPKNNLPRLTDLIASAKFQKLTPHKKSHSPKSPHLPVETVAEIAANQKTLINQDDSQRKGNTREQTPSIKPAQRHPIPDSDSGLSPYQLAAEVNADASVVRVEAHTTSTHEIEALYPEQTPDKLLNSHWNAESEKLSPFTQRSVPQPDFDIPPIKKEVLVVQESRPQTPDPPMLPTTDPFRFPSVEPDALKATSYNLYGLDNLDNSSPAKSLSSLAGSDSESGSDEEDGDKTAENIAVSQDLRFVGHEFNPRFTSTQKPGLEPIKDAIGNSLPSDWPNGKLPSTSQLQAEINSQVDEFDKFMEADLGYDPVAP